MILFLTLKNLEVVLLSKKYVIFKDDDVGKDFDRFKKWIEIVIENDAKAAVGLIGKYMKDKELSSYLNSLEYKKIEIFCHGYSHSNFPFYLRKIWRNNKILPVEFDRNENSHDSSLKKYRRAENKYLDRNTITFGPPGNVWNDRIIDPLLQNGFKIMFSWKMIKYELFKIPLSNNLWQNSFDEYLKIYEKNKNDPIYTLQFHHGALTENQFQLMFEVIDFLRNKENRIFVTPTELLKISKNDKTIFKLMAPENMK
jgi:DNA primase